MTNIDPNKAQLQRAGNILDTIFKPKLTVRIWVLVVFGLVTNLIGVRWHF